ncbi:MAG: hypothetical protein IJ417_00265 [Bacteroidaceae bacterium]|nr:hypothetical protein [Bacteroidaceae bacterium]
MEKIKNGMFVLMTFSALLLMSSCVNDDYDLNGEIDMTVQVGGDLEVPVSDTDEMTLDDILELDAESIVKSNPETHVYELRKEADSPSTFEFDLPEITVNNPQLKTFSMSFTMPTEEVLMEKFGVTPEALALLKMDPTYPGNIPGIDEIRESIPVELHREFDVLNYEFDMPEEVVALSHISFKQPLRPDFDMSTDMPLGELGLHDVYAEFPSELDHDDITMGGTWGETVDGHHEYNLPKDVWLKQGEHKRLNLEFVGITMDWNRAEDGDALELERPVAMHGWVTIRATGREFLQLAGKTFKMNTDITLTKLDFSEATVMVDPKIDEEATTVELDDLPDFLTEEDVIVVLQQPAIRFLVESNIPVDVNCWGKIETDKGLKVNISEPNSNGISLGGAALENWCIYGGTQPQWGSGYAYYKVEGLTDILRKVPRTIDLSFKARVSQQFYTLSLGKTYSATIDYAMECPLAFGQGSQVVYADTIKDWHADLEDFDLNKLKLAATVHNGTSLDELDLTIQPIGTDGKVLEGVAVSDVAGVHDGDAIDFTVEAVEPGALKLLDGVILKVKAKVTKADSAPLKSTDAIRLDNIRLAIIDGVIIDLN